MSTILINCPNSYLERYSVSFANWGPTGVDVRHSGFEVVEVTADHDPFERVRDYDRSPGFYTWACEDPEGPYDSREEAIVTARGLDLY